mmetsp:Transcript_17837/g.24480  ORF Transcript_17837/g.24480 Transcript_17837/m.24480 type:complete len:111 (-) Transcript_17837:154-486(-)
MVIATSIPQDPSQMGHRPHKKAATCVDCTRLPQFHLESRKVPRSVPRRSTLRHDNASMPSSGVFYFLQTSKALAFELNHLQLALQILQLGWQTPKTKVTNEIFQAFILTL